MRISFKESEDKLSCEVFVDEVLAGSVHINVYNQKWFLKPNFQIPNHVTSYKQETHNSWYDAGKKLAQLHRSWGKRFEQLDEINFGVDLDEIMSFLRFRR
jgi:fructosamine-3-kinase|tara:strand:+ start:1140 stop:1439 length:300 start_codon:yes stop_codon:yes gene_type:complete